MKEKIYTIPINDAINENSECPFCIIAKNLETEAVDYTLGAAMMEPDYRILCNEKGFCNHHFSMLFKKNNKLSLALVLDTHLETFREKFKNLSPVSSKKKSFFKKDSSFSSPQKSCVICEKTDTTLRRYAEVFFYMWKNDKSLKERVLSSKGFCMPHFYFLAEAAKKYLHDEYDFINPIYEKQISELSRIQEEIHRFTLKFDYRNKNMDWQNTKDAPIRTVEKLSGYIETEE